MEKLILTFLFCSFSIFSNNTEKLNMEIPQTTSLNSEKIKVLNFATFHMESTTDATSVEFDENDKKNQEEARKIAQMISAFKPTIICVEKPPQDEEKLNQEYQKYLSNPQQATSYRGEIGLIAFEVGKLSGVTQLHGIDHEMEYNYNIGYEITNTLDSTTVKNFYSNPLKNYPELNVNVDELPLLERLRLGNTPQCMDFLMTINADLLTFIGTEDGFEGADEAAKFYHRNLRTYSNLNRIPATKEDRIFILSGGSHAAFLKEFMERSPKYEVVNTLDYLK
ncbi:MAG: DUF5694 domain-containing protein [Saprospiraceae bacterium]